MNCALNKVKTIDLASFYILLMSFLNQLNNEKSFKSINAFKLTILLSYKFLLPSSNKISRTLLRAFPQSTKWMQMDFTEIKFRLIGMVIHLWLSFSFLHCLLLGLKLCFWVGFRMSSIIIVGPKSQTDPVLSRILSAYRLSFCLVVSSTPLDAHPRSPPQQC